MSTATKKLLYPFLFIVCTAFTQNLTRAQDIDTLFARFTHARPHEKLYLHFDNTRYLAGATIYYKGYLVCGLAPSLLSKNLYIDWYNDQGKLISSSVTPIINGYSPGNFTIPKTYVGRLIHAVAYTRWLRNFDSTYLCHQAFVIGANQSPKKSDASSFHTISAQFLPESGNFILNKRNIIAFKAITSLGRPEHIKGIVRNSKGDSILSFKSSHDGMGKFPLKPAGGEVYTAVWTDLSGVIHKSVLPIAQDSMVNLILEAGRGNRVFNIQRTQLAPDRFKQLTLVGQIAGTIVYKMEVDLTTRESFTANLPLSQFPTGIFQLTVFDAISTPICERLLFIKNKNSMVDASVSVDTLNKRHRGKNVIEIDLHDTSLTNLSIAITDAHFSASQDNNIVSRLLLTNDLSGHVWNPAYYFSSDADSVSDHLDLLMLTNGWTRYNWNEILAQKDIQLKYPPESSYQDIYGKIIGYQPKKSEKPELINLIFVAKDASKSIITVPISAEGKFVVHGVMIFDTSKVYFSMNGSPNINSERIELQNSLFKTKDTTIQGQFAYQVIPFENSQDPVLHWPQPPQDGNNFQVLDTVSVYSKERTRLQELNAKYATGIFATEAAAAFDMSTLENAGHRTSIFDFLTGKVPELQIGATNGGTATEGVVQFRRGAVTFYLDEVPISTSDLLNINVEDIALIKIFNPPFAGGFNQSGGEIASGGAIAIYRKKGMSLKAHSGELLSNIMKYKLLTGYSPHKELYQPFYTESSSSEKVEDMRPTLFWNPWIELDRTTNKARIVFYNNDLTESFRIVIEGMDCNGKLVHIEKLL